jgi:hypothetical protein
MTTKRTKKTEATETTGTQEPLHVHSASVSIEEVDTQHPLAESLDDIIAGVHKLTAQLERQRHSLDEFRIKPWHMLAAFWLGGVIAVAGVTAANKNEVMLYTPEKAA